MPLMDRNTKFIYAFDGCLLTDLWFDDLPELYWMRGVSLEMVDPKQNLWAFKT